MRIPLVLTMRCCAVMLCAAAIAGCGSADRGAGDDASAVTLDVAGTVGSDTVAPFIYFANLEDPQGSLDAAFCPDAASADQLNALAERIEATPAVFRPADFLLESVVDGRHRYHGTVVDDTVNVWLTFERGDDYPCIAAVDVEPVAFTPLFDPLYEET